MHEVVMLGKHVAVLQAERSVTKGRLRPLALLLDLDLFSEISVMTVVGSIGQDYVRGSMGCAASPMTTHLPLCQPRIGSRSRICQRAGCGSKLGMEVPSARASRHFELNNAEK